MEGDQQGWLLSGDYSFKNSFEGTYALLLDAVNADRRKVEKLKERGVLHETTLKCNQIRIQDRIVQERLTPSVFTGFWKETSACRYFPTRGTKRQVATFPPVLKLALTGNL